MINWLRRIWHWLRFGSTQPDYVSEQWLKQNSYDKSGHRN